MKPNKWSVCRVCGITFASERQDAKTCSSTCRSRLHRGGDLAYISRLSKREQRQARNYHAIIDRAAAAHKEAVAATREAREAKRAIRRLKAPPVKIVRIPADPQTEALANAMRKQLEKEAQLERQKLLGSVAGISNCSRANGATT